MSLINLIEQDDMVPIIMSGFSLAGDIFDDFNRADSDTLGSKWTEVVGDTDIVSNAASFQSTSFSKCFSIYSAQSCTTINQYAKFMVTFSAQCYVGIIFRYTDASSAFMGLQVGSTEDTAFWTYYSNSTATSVDVTSGAITVNSGDTFGVTITGTGTNTIVRVWRNITANAPTSASLWDGTAPTLEFTTNPPNPVDTGFTVGIEGYTSAAGTSQLDNFYAGDIPA